jgi:pilus assembly protein CpaB
LRRTSRLVLLLGVFLAAITFIVIILLFGGGGAPGTPAATAAPTTRQVVVATQDIKVGTLVTGDMLTTEVKPLGAINAGAFQDPSQAIGNTARKNITAGAQVGTDAFGGAGAGKIDVTGQLETGRRAFAISVNELTGVGNLVQAGDSVDVLISLGGSAFPVVSVLPDGTITVVSGLNPLSVKLPLLLEDIHVIGTIDQVPAAPAQGAAPAASAAPVLTGASKLVILAVTPAQAEVLLFARTTGTLDVVLRSPLDSGVTETTDGVILKTLIDKYGVLPPELVQIALPRR